MAVSYGLTNPATFLKQFEEYPDLFKFYSAYPESTTESSAANKRRPHLFTGFSGASWGDETEGNFQFYNMNYGGNFYFNSYNSHLEAWSHRSLSTSYNSYPASAKSPILPGKNKWTAGTGIPRNTSNQISRYVERSHSISKPNRYFCIKVGGGVVYNDSPWSTPGWTTTNFGTGFQCYDDSSTGGGFRQLKINPEQDHEMIVIMHSDTTNKYIRICLVNTDNLTLIKDYTSTICGSTTWSPSTYKSMSVEYLPNIGYIFIYSYGSAGGFRVRILRTHDLSTGELLSDTDYYYNNDLVSSITDTNSTMLYLGSRAQYCYWTKELFFAPNAYIIYWTKDGLNWSVSQTTGKTSSTKCNKLFVNGTNIVMATDALNWVFSQDKGESWETLSKGTNTSSTQGIFYADRSNDGIVIPFKCNNNIGINENNVILGYWLNTTDGSPTVSAANFYTNDYISVDPDTSYVFYGVNKQNKNTLTRNARITWYTSNKTWIQTDEGTSFISGNYQPCIRTSPSNAAYARISCRPLPSGTVTQASVDSYKWYFAKESDFQIMNNYGDLYGN